MLFNFQHIESVYNASPSLSKSDLSKAPKGCTDFEESVSLSFLICWSNNSFLIDFLPPDEIQNGPFIPHHQGCVCVCVQVYSCMNVCSCVRANARGPGSTLRQWLADLIWCLISQGWVLICEGLLAPGWLAEWCWWFLVEGCLHWQVLWDVCG